MLRAVSGAFLVELTADLLGWTRRPDGVPADVLPLGGRTVLGGLPGGWLLVEVVKAVSASVVPPGTASPSR